MTSKRLKKQLKESHAEIVKLREENRKMKEKIEEHLDLCEEALENIQKEWSRDIYPYKNK
jgi:hypothetical protein